MEVETDVELENGTIIRAAFDRQVQFTFDPNYGADADGRRGAPMTFIDDDTQENLWVNCSRTENPDRWVEVTKLRKSNQERVLAAVDSWCEKNDPDPCDYEPEEPDYEPDI